MKKYLTARMSVLGGTDKVWKFKNPWASWKYRIHKIIWLNGTILPIVCSFWVWLYRLADRKQRYYLMRKAVSGLKEEKVILEENKYASCYCPKCNNSWFSDVKPDEKSKKRCPKCGNIEISYRR